ncbi:MAG: transcription elongation factor GreA [Clostridia bacterium]|nr:transcription elongation factor GreA [Clostridia bacterium]
MAKQIVVTESGLKKITDELEYLKNVKRKEAAENVGIARSFGDLSENSEYDEAKNEQAKIEAQISELEETLAHVKVIGDHEIQTNTVSIGVSVVVYDMGYNEEVEYHLVSSREVDPLQNKISDQSPLGKAIIGAKVGDVVSAEVPAGTIKVRIVSIKKNDDEE